MSGLFVSFEGGEGVGKSTQIRLAGEWVRSLGREVVETREPGGTPLGVDLRRLVLDPDGNVTPRAEALLYAADRAHHVDTVIAPALANAIFNASGARIRSLPITAEAVKAAMSKA